MRVEAKENSNERGPYSVCDTAPVTRALVRSSPRYARDHTLSTETDGNPVNNLRGCVRPHLRISHVQPDHRLELFAARIVALATIDPSQLARVRRCRVQTPGRQILSLPVQLLLLSLALFRSCNGMSRTCCSNLLGACWRMLVVWCETIGAWATKGGILQRAQMLHDQMLRVGPVTATQCGR